MKTDRWDSGTPIEIKRLGRCTAYRRIINGEFYQWKIRYGFVEVIGDYAISNEKALENVFKEICKRFKSVL